MSEPRLMEQAFRFELAPGEAHVALLRQYGGANRFFFNQALAEVKARLDRRKAGEEDVDVPWSYKGLCSVLDAEWRASVAPWQQALACGTYQAAFEALGAALQNFTNARKDGRKVGFPAFRKKGRCTESVLFQRPTLIDARHVQFHRDLGPMRVKESMRKLVRLLERDEHAASPVRP